MSQNRWQSRNRNYLIFALGLALSGALTKSTIAETVVNRIKQANRVVSAVNACEPVWQIYQQYHLGRFGC